MAFTHTVTRSYRDSSGNTLSSVETPSANAENNYDNLSISLPSSLFAIAWEQLRSSLVSMMIKTSNAVIVETNTSGTAYTDLAIDGTNDLKVTSVSHSFVSGDVGSWVVVVSGTGFTPAAYQIASVSSGAAILASSPGATSTTGGHWHLSADYFTLIAGQDLVWTSATDGLTHLPFNNNVTELFVTPTGSSGTATFQIRALTNL